MGESLDGVKGRVGTGSALHAVRNQIADAAIVWADSVTAGLAMDERPPKLQSNFQHRVTGSDALQEIRRLVKQLHEMENPHARMDR